MEDMEFTEINRTLSGFDGVWQRVSGQQRRDGNSESGGTNRTLRALIEDEEDFCRENMALARASQGSCRNNLMRLAEDARQRANQLRAELFIRTGDVSNSSGNNGDKRNNNRSQSRLCCLRDAMNSAEELARDYRAADRRTGNETLSCLYDQFAEEADDAACQLRRMIVNSFT